MPTAKLNAVSPAQTIEQFPARELHDHPLIGNGAVEGQL